MNMKRILAAAAASVVAVSAMSAAAFADKFVNSNSGDNYLFDLIEEGYNVTEVCGVTFTISGDFAESGIGGGIGFNSATTGWDQTDWGNADAGKTITITEDNKITILRDAPVFAESDTTGENPYAQVWISKWWGNDATVEGVEVLGAGGTVLSAGNAAPADPAPADPAPAASESKTDESKTDTKPNVDTGVEGVAAVVGVAAVAAGALIVAKKRK